VRNRHKGLSRGETCDAHYPLVLTRTAACRSNREEATQCAIPTGTDPDNGQPNQSGGGNAVRGTHWY